MNEYNPLVSISCLTYNHAAFIIKCFEGFLMQKTNFTFEVVLHDDASIDGTKEIIEKYTSQYPNIFFPMFQSENQYSKGVRGMMMRFNFPRCRGKYIALCEGDDYWTDENKLQKQVDFLEKNSDYSLCFHNFYYLSNNNLKLSSLFNGDSISLSDYAKDLNGIQTLTVMYRNIVNLFDDEKVNSKVRGSKFIFIRLAEYGKMKYINEPMAVYRVHSGGIWSGIAKFDQAKMGLENIEAMILYFHSNIKIKKILKETYCNSSLNFLRSLMKMREYKNAIELIIISIKSGTKYFNISFPFYYINKMIQNKK